MFTGGPSVRITPFLYASSEDSAKVLQEGSQAGATCAPHEHDSEWLADYASLPHISDPKPNSPTHLTYGPRLKRKQLAQQGSPHLEDAGLMARRARAPKSPTVLRTHVITQPSSPLIQSAYPQHADSNPHTPCKVDSPLVGVESKKNLPRLKCVLVGDGAIGKTSLIVSYTTNGYPTEYVPTAFDNYEVVVTVDKKPVCVQLCDTAGQDDFDSLRPLCYPASDVFLLGFSVVNPTSFHNVTEKWIPEINKHCPKAPTVLIGTQCDLRSDVKVLIELARYGEQPVEESVAAEKARAIGAAAYMECSALTQKNMKEVFDLCILEAMMNRGLIAQGKKQSKGKKKQYKCNFDMWNGSPSLHAKLSANQRTGLSKKGWRKLCCVL